MTKNDKNQNRFTWLIYTVVFLFLSIGGTEILFRIVQYPSLQYYRNLKLLHVYSPEYMVGLKPDADLYLKHHLGLWEGTFTTNSLGYRGSPEVDPDSPQIGCLGDSVVMGFGVSDDETFCSYLNGVSIDGKKAQAQNLGVDAFGSRGAYERLREASEKIKFKAVVFVVSPNDFVVPESLRERGVLPDDESDAMRWNDTVYREKFRLQFEATRASYTLMAVKLAYEQIQIKWMETVSFLKNELKKSGLHPDYDSKPDERPDRLSRFSEYFMDSFQRDMDSPRCVGNKVKEDTISIKKSSVHSAKELEELHREFRKKYCPSPMPADLKCIDSIPDPSTLESLPEITIRAYDAMIQQSKRKGFKLIPVFIPIQNEVIHCAARGKHHSLYNYALRAQDYFRKKGIKYLEFRPSSYDMCGEPVEENGVYRPSVVEDYYIPGDGHYTSAGNKIIGRKLRESIEKMERENAF